MHQVVKVERQTQGVAGAAGKLLESPQGRGPCRPPEARRPRPRANLQRRRQSAIRFGTAALRSLTLNAKLFLAVGVVVVASTGAVFIFGIRVAALATWVVVVGTASTYGRREAARDRAERGRREQARQWPQRVGRND